MRGLAAVGLYDSDGDERFTNTELGDAFRADAPRSVAGLARFVGRPYHWQTYASLRQYPPRRLDFRQRTQADSDTIAKELNERPRQTLKFKTPSESTPQVAVKGRPHKSRATAY
jgi:hypothetical protein